MVHPSWVACRVIFYWSHVGFHVGSMLGSMLDPILNSMLGSTSAFMLCRMLWEFGPCATVRNVVDPMPCDLQS